MVCLESLTPLFKNQILERISVKFDSGFPSISFAKVNKVSDNFMKNNTALVRSIFNVTIHLHLVTK